MRAHAHGAHGEHRDEHAALAPGLSKALIVPNLTENTWSELTRAEDEAMQEAEKGLSAWSGHAYIIDTRLRHFTQLSEHRALLSLDALQSRCQ
jgi:hypothetical protein